jgi:integrase
LPGSRYRRCDLPIVVGLNNAISLIIEHERKADEIASPQARQKRCFATSRCDDTAYRVREHLTEAEMDKLVGALRRNRHGQRDWLIGLLIYRHGLRVSEACDLRGDDIDFAKRTIDIRRLKGSHDSRHYLERDELIGLRVLQRHYSKQAVKSSYVFVNERGQPFGRMGRPLDRASW